MLEERRQHRRIGHLSHPQTRPVEPGEEVTAGAPVPPQRSFREAFRRAALHEVLGEAEALLEFSPMRCAPCPFQKPHEFDNP